MIKLPHPGALFSTRARMSFASLAISLILLLPAAVMLFSSGCSTAPTDENLPTPTFTLNATQIAISVMLTETRAAPTITITSTGTQAPTPTATLEMPITGSEKQPGVAGERVALGGQALTVLSSSQPAQLGALKMKDGHTLLDYEVLLENLSSTQQEYNPYFFKLAAGSSTEYQPIASTLFPGLQGGTLLPGEWVRGHIAFDLPASAPAGSQGLRLRYAPQAGPPDSKTAIWIDLSQPAAKKPAALPKGPATILPEDGLPGPNKRVEAAGIALTVGQPSASQRIQYTRAADGNVLISLPVTIENVSRPLTPYNPEYFILKDEQGYEYPAIAVPLETVLQAGSLKQGQHISSTVIFQVHASARQLVVKYQPQVLSGTYEEIRIGLTMP